MSFFKIAPGKIVNQLVFGIILGVFVLFSMPSIVLGAAPEGLLANYIGQTQPGEGQEQLTWTGTGTPGETYNVWQSIDGMTWTKLNSSPLATTSFTMNVNEWVNYWFVVTTSTVTNFPTASDSTNTTNVAKAFPPDVNKHEYYTASTNLCAECHETHTASGPSLLKEQTITDMCLFCHDGSGSKYNELDGITGGPNPGDPVNQPILYTTPAGPFGSVTQSRTWTGSITVTSSHPIGIPLSAAPGGDGNASTAIWNEPLSCGSCHQPHNPSNYRLLKSDLPDATNVKVSAFAKTDPDNYQETVLYKSGMNDFCQGCHTDYMAGSGSGHTELTNKYSTTMGTRRHAIGVSPSGFWGKSLSTTLPLEGTYQVTDPQYGDNKIICLTCHKAHGTDMVYAENPEGNSYLLRQAPYITGNSNVDLCQNCHNIDPIQGK
jgi:predicted CXXCH cytochrome family protein